MKITAPSLTEFLLARIAEDETVPWHMDWCKEVGDDTWPCNCKGTARVLAECEAKRRIIGERNDDDPPWVVMRHLAAVYADHPDYRDEWKY
jgi:hypothetical protein